MSTGNNRSFIGDLSAFLNRAQNADIISVAQADALLSFAGESPPAPHLKSFKRFSEIFISVGLGLFLYMLYSHLANSYPQFTWPMPELVLGLLSWFGAEYVNRKRLLNLPSIVLASVFALASFSLLEQLIGWPSLTSNALLVLLLGAYFFRFKLAFVLLPLSIAGLFAYLMPIFMLFGQEWSITGSSESKVNLLFLTFMSYGIAMFCIAYRLDSRAYSERTQDYRNMAFWLHAVAATLLVHSSALYLLSHSENAPLLRIILILLLISYAIISLVINRRVGMFSVVMYILYVFQAGDDVFKLGGSVFQNFWLVVGGILLLLGLFWDSTRHAVLQFLGRYLDLPKMAQMPELAYRPSDKT